MHGYIYRLSARNAEDGECYIGSTTTPLSHRLYMHKYLSKTQPERKVYQYFNSLGGWDNVKVEVLEDIENVDDRKTLRMRERHWVDQEKATLNTNIPGRTRKEWYSANLDRERERMRNYYQNNKEAVKLKIKKWIQNNREHWNAYYREYNKRKREQQSGNHTA